MFSLLSELITYLRAAAWNSCIMDNEFNKYGKLHYMTGFNPEPCSICGTPTVYLCADCMIDNSQKVRVCISSTCRDKHESLNICNQTVKV